MYHIYRARKKKRLVYAEAWDFKHNARNEWYIGYTNELTYKVIDELDLQYMGYMTHEELETIIG
ncbi:hypothetical protein [Trichococcus collinsii]|uniref:Uncharacterized protein n=1 Tax=Trichococcus collinsii TaxID=157076 RepID=A0AB37ZXD0_9LACT|nr:hypothetical protein [Trichococcus collinsii]CZR02439.1 Hypothetical protein Tcol_2044 [Trichococcus collinsii]SDZ95237.1 hypothetical protein SAMN04488525_101708 [Trichococcus collinsii]